MVMLLDKKRVVTQWNEIIENCAGNRERVYKEMEKYLANSNLPHITWRRDDVRGEVFGAIYPFMIVHHARFHDYTVFVRAYDYGQHLDCAWYLTCTPGLLKRAISRFAADNQYALSLNLDALSHRDIEVWISCVHHAFQQSIEDLERYPRGRYGDKDYLSIW